MRFLELDEAQGLTPEMVREWLRANSYRLKVSDAAGEVWNGVQGLPVVLYHDGSELAGAVGRAASIDGRSVQALLRDINPRMRHGMPSDAARDAHQGHAGRWIASRCDEYTHTTIVSFLRGMTAVKLQFEDHRPTHDPSAELEKWSFWPCDAHGNKVRWPEKEGVML